MYHGLMNENFLMLFLKLNIQLILKLPLKFLEFQDFNVDFRIVADKKREQQFLSTMTFSAFKNIEHSVKFLSYDVVADLTRKNS